MRQKAKALISKNLLLTWKKQHLACTKAELEFYKKSVQFYKLHERQINSTGTDLFAMNSLRIILKRLPNNRFEKLQKIFKTYRNFGSSKFMHDIKDNQKQLNYIFTRIQVKGEPKLKPVSNYDQKCQKFS